MTYLWRGVVGWRGGALHPGCCLLSNSNNDAADVMRLRNQGRVDSGEVPPC